MDKLQLLGETQNSKYFLRADGIIFVRTISSMPLTKEIMQENLKMAGQIYTELGRPLRILVESEKMQRINRCARDYMRTKATEQYDQYVLKTAMLTKNQLSKMLANFIIGLRRQAHPMKIFTNEGEALAWLENI